ncbi:MAG: restriction endonuclease subunit S [Algiphilus sp.]
MKAEQALSILDRLGGSTIEEIQRFRELAVALAVSGKLGSDCSCASLDQWANETTLSSLGVPLHSLRIEPDQLPEGFLDATKFVRLGAVANIEKGKTAITKALPGAFPLVVTGAERKPCDHYDFEGPAVVVPLVSSTGHGRASINRLHYQEGQFALGTILAAVFPKDSGLFSARFLFEYLSTFTEDLLVSRMTGTANVTLTVGRLADVPVPVVDPKVQESLDELMVLCDRLEEQHGTRETTRDRLTTATLSHLTAPDTDIQSFRDHARFALDTLPALTARPDQIKGLRQTVLGLAVRGKLVDQDLQDEPATELLHRISIAKDAKRKATRDSRIKQAPPPPEEAYREELPDGWGIQSFENLFLFIDYRGKTPPKTSAGIPLITAKNVRMGSLNKEPREYVTQTTYERWMTRGLPRVGDLLFTTEAPLANVCLNGIDEPFALAQRIVCLQPYGDVNTGFLLLAIMSDVIQNLIAEHATGMTAKGIKTARLKPLPLPIPPLAEQQRIVAKVDELMALCDRLEASLQQADDKRARLLEALLAQALAPAEGALEAA